MKYNKNPYYLNTELRNNKNKGIVLDEGFSSLVDWMEGMILDGDFPESAGPIYEVGFDFGQRLDFLESKGFKIEGGVEFNSTFNLYKKHYNLMDRGWDIRFTQLDYWNPINRTNVLTYHFIDSLDPEDRPVILRKLKFMSSFLYMRENVDIDEPDENVILRTPENIYVIDCRGYVCESTTTGDGTPKVELPNIESLRDRVDTDESIVPETFTDESEGLNPPSGFQW